MYRTEARHEFLKLIRVPIFAVTTVAFPLMFYVIFGLTFADESAGGVGVTTYMLATYGAFGVIGGGPVRLRRLASPSSAARAG